MTNLLPPLRLPRFTFFDITENVEALPHSRNLALSLAERDRGLMYLEMCVPLRDMTRALLHGADPLAQFSDDTIIPKELFTDVVEYRRNEGTNVDDPRYRDMYAHLEIGMIDFFGPGWAGRLALRSWRDEHGDGVFERFIWPDGIRNNIDAFREAFPDDCLVVPVHEGTTPEDVDAARKAVRHG